MKKKEIKKEWLSKWWWTILFCLASYIFFDSAQRKKDKEIFTLQQQMQQIRSEQQLLAHQKDELTARIESQNDPEWVELVLMKELGVVPEGYMKVYFKKDP